MEFLRYDPHKHINSDAWLALDESKRAQLVVQYHRQRHIRVPNKTIHALIHVIVENQIALGDAFPAKGVLLRLMREGLDRHEAIHAIGSVLSETFFTTMNGKTVSGGLNAHYVEKLRALSADSWRRL